jgi:ribosome modulation factor
MANDTDQAAPAPGPGTSLQTTAPAQARAAKVYDPVTDVVPILDTARFEHMQRIATIMAGSSLIPDSLRIGGSGNDKYELAPATVVANCFLIVNQAVRWGMDPFAVASSTSVVHGRLMYEGKLVAAVLESKLGLQLKYEFGTWMPDTETVDLTKEGKGDALGVRVSAQRAGDDEPVFIEGSVGIWKTTGANSPWRPGAMKRQLRYRGAREWSRAYNSGLMLGVITDDELDVLAERREHAQRLAGPKPSEGAKRPLQAGFGDETDQIVRKGAQSDEPTPGPDSAANPAEATQAQAEGAATPISGETGTLALDSTEDELLQAYNDGADAAASGEAREAPEHLADDQAERFLEGWDAKADELAKAERAMLEPAEPTVAPADEVYLLAGEGFSTAGRRKTYKNGFSHSSVGEKGAAELKEYDQHTPVIDDKEKPAEDAPPAEDPPAEETAEPETGAAAPPADDSFPGDPKPEEGEEASEPNPFLATHEKINAAASWLEIKQCLRDISVTEAYKGAEDEGKRMLRLWAFEAYKELREAGKEAVEPSADITLFRFWLEFDAESEDQINALFRALHKSPAYADATEPDKRVLGDMISRKKAALAEAAK